MMAEQHSNHAVVICTRNRPDALFTTLKSVVHIADLIKPLLIVVDASDLRASTETEKHTSTINKQYPGRVRYHRFTGAPSSARQRNKGIDLLPNEVHIVHFIDDDVTLQPGYFGALENIFHQHSNVGGVGALIKDDAVTARYRGFWHRFFLLDSGRPGSVLPSGHVSFGQTLPDLPRDAPPFQVEWLSTCGCAYRREVLSKFRFDDELDRQTTEDRDLSFRVSKEWTLLVQPKARLKHRASLINRADPEQAAFERLVNRLRFVRRTMNHPKNYIAFWWAEFGQLIALALSSKPGSRNALRGKWRALKHIVAVRSSNHPKPRIPS